MKDELQKAFWIHLGSILGRFGEHLAKDLGGFRSFRRGWGQTWGLARFKTDLGGPPAHTVWPHISYRNPRAASLRPAERHNSFWLSHELPVIQNNP